MFKSLHVILCNSEAEKPREHGIMSYNPGAAQSQDLPFVRKPSVRSPFALSFGRPFIRLSYHSSVLSFVLPSIRPSFRPSSRSLANPSVVRYVRPSKHPLTSARSSVRKPSIKFFCPSSVCPSCPSVHVLSFPSVRVLSCPSVHDRSVCPRTRLFARSAFRPFVRPFGPMSECTPVRPSLSPSTHPLLRPSIICPSAHPFFN